MLLCSHYCLIAQSLFFVLTEIDVRTCFLFDAGSLRSLNVAEVTLRRLTDGAIGLHRSSLYGVKG